MPSITVLSPTVVHFNALQIDVPVQYGEDDMPFTFFGRDGDRWRVTILLAEDGTAQLKDWVESAHDLCMKVTDGGTYRLFMKVTDGGTYRLLLDDKVVAVRENYVPLCLGGGDYVELIWDETGRILGERENGWKGDYRDFWH